jgi:hypothetical protein
MSLGDVLGAASNPLAWHNVAGKTVSVSDGIFFHLTKVVGNTYLIAIHANQFASTVLSCTVAPDSMSTVATLKMNDPVTLIGKLAASPGGIAGIEAQFDGPCLVTAPAARPVATGPLTPEVSTTLEKFLADSGNNAVAFQQKYMGKVVQLSGGQVGRMGPDYLIIANPTGPYHIPLNVLNCWVQPSGRAGIASLNAKQKVTVTGFLKGQDSMKTGNLAPILEDCTFK